MKQERYHKLIRLAACLAMAVGTALGMPSAQAVDLLVLNRSSNFEPIKSTYKTISDAGGCPSGFVGKFSFDARLTNKNGSPPISDLVTKVKTLPNGNLLRNADDGDGGVGSTVTVLKKNGYADDILSPGEFVDVNFIVCLKNKKSFVFVVDVLGIKQNHVKAVTDRAETTRDKSVTIDVLKNDVKPNGDGQIASFTQPTRGTVTKNADNTLTYTPKADATTGVSVDDSFSYVLGSGTSNSTAQVIVTVVPAWGSAQQVNVTTNIAHIGEPIDPNIPSPNNVVVTDPLQVLVDKNTGVVTAIWQEKIGTELSLFAGRMINGAWQAPEEIDHGAGGVTGYDAVIDSNGVVTVLFVQSDGSVENVWSRRYTTSWQPEQAVERATDPVWGSYGHDLVVDGQNVPTAFWVQDGVIVDPIIGTGTIPRSRLVMASQFSNNAWTTPAQVESFDLGYSIFAKAVVDKSGGITALFAHDITVSGVDLYANRFENGAWSASPLTLGLSLPFIDYTFLLDAVVNDAGDVTALIGEHQFGGNSFVLGVFRPNGQNWQTAQILGPQADCCVSGRLVVDSVGTVTAVWHTVDAQGAVSKLAARRDTLGWTSAVSISAGAVSSDALALGVDASNRVYAAFIQDSHVNVARYNSGQWEAPKRLDSASGRADLPALVTSANGDVTVIWEQNESNPEGSSMWAARLQNGIWQPAQLLENRTSSYASAKQLVVDQAGLTTAVWQHSTPQGWILLSNTYR